MLALTICLPIAFAIVLLAAVVLRLIPAGERSRADAPAAIPVASKKVV
ncbi:hypothetical protein [Rhizobium sp. Rhizsp82]